MLHADAIDMPVAKVPYGTSKTVVTKKTEQKTTTPNFYTQNTEMARLCHKCKLVAKSEASVLLTGESGSGKEVLAQMIHNESNRAHKPFIAINCGALPKDIIENELFGHEKGAFTGALHRKEGCFEYANEGTLFLDEIGEMNPETQVKLLRAVETGGFRRLGGTSEVQVDIRIISATNKNMSEALKNGSFREDLYYRLGVVEFEIPSLRYRKDDIPYLANLYLNYYQEKYSRELPQFTDEAIELLVAYDWPGNVRELRNVMEYLTVTCLDSQITAADLPGRISGGGTAASASAEPEHLQLDDDTVSFPLGTTMKQAENLLINRTLAFVGNNKSEAARILGVSRKTLHNKLAGLEEA